MNYRTYFQSQRRSNPAFARMALAYRFDLKTPAESEGEII